MQVHTDYEQDEDGYMIPTRIHTIMLQCDVQDAYGTGDMNDVIKNQVVLHSLNTLRLTNGILAIELCNDTCLFTGAPNSRLHHDRVHPGDHHFLFMNA